MTSSITTRRALALVTLATVVMVPALAGAAPPPHPTPPPHPRGYLYVVASSPMKVSIDGMPVGETPVLREVSVGKHSITCSDATISDTRFATLIGNQRITITCRPTEPPSPPKPPAPSPLAPAPAGTLDTSPPQRPVTIRVTAKPWAQVYIDDRPHGTAPVIATRQAGRHTVVCRKGEQTIERRELVDPGATLDVACDFTKP